MSKLNPKAKPFYPIIINGKKEISNLNPEAKPFYPIISNLNPEAKPFYPKDNLGDNFLDFYFLDLLY